MNPVAGSSLYFVARGDGSHVFSDDLDAHNRRCASFSSSVVRITAPARRQQSRLKRLRLPMKRNLQKRRLSRCRRYRLKRRHRLLHHKTRNDFD